MKEKSKITLTKQINLYFIGEDIRSVNNET